VVAAGDKKLVGMMLAERALQEKAIHQTSSERANQLAGCSSCVENTINKYT